MSKIKLLLKRKFKGEAYTVGDLLIDGEFFCNTIEDKVRLLPETCPDTPKDITCKCREKIYNLEGTLTFRNDSIIIMKEMADILSDPNFERFGSAEYTIAFVDEASEISEKPLKCCFPDCADGLTKLSKPRGC